MVRRSNRGRWRDFPHPSRLAVGSHSLQYIGCRVILGVKAAEAWHWPPTPSSSEVKERVYVCCPSGPSWVNFIFSSICSTYTGLCCFLHVAVRIQRVETLVKIYALLRWFVCFTLTSFSSALNFILSSPWEAFNVHFEHVNYTIVKSHCSEAVL